ncbi:MAG: DUF2924 domain-containing protein [Hyphomonas sp.]|uniref:DUF2924 domain-containing protein n=1 Tax=Hyphomonas sp. TaxID=87 RepID=UPI0032994A22
MGLEGKIRRLIEVSPSQKKAERRKVFGSPAPPAFGIAMMTRAIAARYQEQALGGLTKAEMRLLEVQSRKEQRHPRGVRPASVEPGTWLSRTRHGEPHEVVVLEGAFEYRGNRYRSLTAIAKHITGAAWSGRRFFGLHSPRLRAWGVTRHG